MVSAPLSKLATLLRSRKFWAAIVGIIMMVVNELFPEFPITPETIEQIVWLLVAYIIGTGIEDSGQLARKK